MHQHGGAQYPLALLAPPFLVLLATASGQESLACREQAVSANGELQLLLERPPKEWIKIDWRVSLDAGYVQRILTAGKNESDPLAKGPFSGRAFFQWDTLSLSISPVHPTDSGVYRAEFEDPSGTVTTLCFRVSVWEPVRQPLLETRVLHQEQGRCNLSLLCTVPGAGAVSYDWSCTGGPAGALEHHPRLQLQVRRDSDPTVCHCNASNLASWAAASTDVAAACRAAAAGLFGTVPLWAVAMGLALVVFAALVAACYWCWKRRKDPLGANIEQMLTVYEEVGKAQTGQDPPQNGTSEATVGGNTIYTVITKTQGPSCPQEPESCTIYSTIQPSRKASSLKKKRLDPALVSTAYVEATGGSRCWCPPSQDSPQAPAGHHLS